MSRPDNLPDFRNPPLTEVVLGVQFNPPEGYQQIHAYEVWNLFRNDFPAVEEHPPLHPQFEMFGRPEGPSINFGFVTGAVHDRFMFITSSGNDLIQFQKDRLLHNWRKRADTNSDYPRYERMVDAFAKEAGQLFAYFTKFDGRVPDINQCEISYLNAIPITEEDRLADWLRFCTFGDLEPDDFNMGLRRTIFDKKGVPQGRLTVESSIGYAPDGSKAVLLNLTARGKPDGTRLDDALEFLAKNREMVVKAFAELTTDSAHEKWERV